MLGGGGVGDVGGPGGCLGDGGGGDLLLAFPFKLRTVVRWRHPPPGEKM